METQSHFNAATVGAGQGYTPHESVVGDINSTDQATTEQSTNIGPEIPPLTPGNPSTDRPEIVPQSPRPEIDEPLGDDPKKWQEEEEEKRRDDEFSQKADLDNLNENRGYNEIREPAPVNPRDSDKGTEETEEYPR
jgi:hypothetical protein